MEMLHLIQSFLRPIGEPSERLQIKSALKRLMNSISRFGSTLTLTKIDSASFFPQTEGGGGLVIATRKRANVNTVIFSKQIS